MKLGKYDTASIEFDVSEASTFMTALALEWCKTLLQNSVKVFDDLQKAGLLKSDYKYSRSEYDNFCKIINKYAPAWDNSELAECVGYWKMRDEVTYVKTHPDIVYKPYKIVEKDGRIFTGEKLVDLGKEKRVRRHHYVLYIGHCEVGG